LWWTWSVVDSASSGRANSSTNLGNRFFFWARFVQSREKQQRTRCCCRQPGDFISSCRPALTGFSSILESRHTLCRSALNKCRRAERNVQTRGYLRLPRLFVGAFSFPIWLGHRTEWAIKDSDSEYIDREELIYRNYCDT
jgi:hypothetical protein